MSFGFSASDVVQCVRFAHKLWKEAKDAPNEFQSIAMEVANFKLVLDEVQESISERELDQRKRIELAGLIDGCNDVLYDLQTLLNKYKSLATRSRRTWDRHRWGKVPINTIRSRLISHTALLNTFCSGSNGRSLARIESLLEQLVLEHRSGFREASVISSHSVGSAEEGDEHTWSQIGRELEDVGITSSMAAEHKDFIIEWLKRALLDGNFDEAAPLQCNTTTRAQPADAHKIEDTCLRTRWTTSRGLRLIRNPLTLLTISGKIDDGTRPPDVVIQLMLRGNVSGSSEDARCYQSNTNVPVTAMSPFRPASYNPLSGAFNRRLARPLLAYSKHRIRNFSNRRHLSFDSDLRSTHPFLAAHNATGTPYWRVTECSSGDYRLFADIFYTKAHLSAFLGAASRYCPDFPPAIGKPWWMVHEWSLDCICHASSLFRIRPSGLDLALDVDADGKLQLSYVKDSVSQLWSFQQPRTAHPKPSPRSPLSNVHENKQHPHLHDSKRGGADTIEDSMQKPLRKIYAEGRPADTTMIQGYHNVIERRGDQGDME